MLIPLVHVTFVRHGESTDNTKSVWAGWKDAPLSNHGMNQARAAGQALASIPFIAIHASDLKRAYTTAEAIRAAQPEPKPPLIPSQLVREQHFGIAEGHPWRLHHERGLSLDGHFARGLYPVIFTRHEKFPEGESSDDLAARAERAIEDLIVPYFIAAVKEEGRRGVHVAVASHGLCISELVAALVRKGAQREGVRAESFAGMANTAWTRAVVEVQDETQIPSDGSLPPLIVRVTDFNQHEHIQKLTRQKGGIGSAAYDPSQKALRDFFGGKKLVAPAVSKPEVVASEHAESNARDAMAALEKKEKTGESS